MKNNINPFVVAYRSIDQPVYYTYGLINKQRYKNRKNIKKLNFLKLKKFDFKKCVMNHMLTLMRVQERRGK